MATSEVIIVSESTDGHAETVIEVIEAKSETEGASDQDHGTVVEVIEAILDPTPYIDLPGNQAELHEHGANDGGDLSPSDHSNETFDHTYVAADLESVDAGTLGDSEYDVGDATSHSGSQDASSAEGSSSLESADAEVQAHADAATEAQQHADDAVASGDYEDAAHAREDAENEAWQAGDSSMLHGSNSAELDHAADLQDSAQQYEQQESRDAEAGNYEAARDDAAHASDATGWADYNAGGTDHTGQAQQEYQQEDWAVWEQDSANADQHTADAYAAEGDLDHTVQYQDSADAHQDAADYHGALGDHDGDVAVHDPSSDVAHDTGYDSYDTSCESDC